MKIKYRHFPHPVLANFLDDFNAGKFDADVDVKAKTSTYEITGSFEIESPDIEKLLKKEMAEYAVHVECSLTCYRRIYTSFSKNFSFTIPSELLEGKVEVATLITAKEDITEYSCQNFNEFFKKYNFKIAEGDILAVGSQFNFDAEKEEDSLKNIPSIFSVQANPTKDNPPALDISTNSDKIIIYLPDETFLKYKTLKTDQNLSTTLASMLVVPVLTEILQKFKEGEGELLVESSHYRWFRVLRKKLKEIDIDLQKPETFTDSTVSVVQKLIGEVAVKAFEDLEEIESALLT